MIKIVRNFLNDNEIKILNEWCLSNYTKEYFIDPKMDPYYTKTRLTTRGSINAKIKYPQEAFLIQQKLITYLKLINPLFPPPFNYGIVNGIGFEFGSIFEHTDPIYFSNTHTVHCNFLTQKSISGGITVINGNEYDINVGDALIYNVSQLPHKVTEIKGKIPRILWCYGFCVADEDIKNIFQYQNIMSKNA